MLLLLGQVLGSSYSLFLLLLLLLLLLQLVGEGDYKEGSCEVEIKL